MTALIGALGLIRVLNKTEALWCWDDYENFVFQRPHLNIKKRRAY